MTFTREETLGALARKFEPIGFATFFSLITGLMLPEHHMRVIAEIFTVYGYDQWVGLVIEMFRGSAKTTVENNAFGAWLVGHFPDKTGLIVQANDEIAGNNSAQIASYIDTNDGWKIAFPHVVPDKDAGWGKQGYFVKKTHTDSSLSEEMTYTQWNKLRAATKDPSFVGLGYNSSAIIGKRPYWLIIDDINDEKNTRSERRLMEVKDILRGTIFPAANQAKIRIVIGTPWNESDAIHYCLSTGLYKHMKVPVYMDGKPTWPDIFNERRIEIEKIQAGEIEFARMYLLDLSKTKGLVLNINWLEPYFPNEEIKPSWPAIMFIDYTSTKDPTKEKSDYFALAVAQLIPGGRKMVISDGVYQRLTHLDAQKLAVSKVLEYPTLLVLGVEAIFTGNEYGQMLEQNQELIDNNIIPKLCRGGPWQKRKGDRFEKILADAFQKGTIVLSDAETPFLQAFKREWLNWQGNALADQGHDDALDAVFGCWHLGKEWIVHGKAYQDYEYTASNPLFKREKTDYSPISGFFGSRK